MKKKTAPAKTVEQVERSMGKQYSPRIRDRVRLRNVKTVTGLMNLASETEDARIGKAAVYKLSKMDLRYFGDLTDEYDNRLDWAYEEKKLTNEQVNELRQEILEEIIDKTSNPEVAEYAFSRLLNVEGVETSDIGSCITEISLKDPISGIAAFHVALKQVKKEDAPKLISWTLQYYQPKEDGGLLLTEALDVIDTMPLKELEIIPEKLVKLFSTRKEFELLDAEHQQMFARAVKLELKKGIGYTSARYSDGIGGYNKRVFAAMLLVDEKQALSELLQVFDKGLSSKSRKQAEAVNTAKQMVLQAEELEASDELQEKMADLVRYAAGDLIEEDRRLEKQKEKELESALDEQDRGLIEIDYRSLRRGSSPWVLAGMAMGIDDEFAEKKLSEWIKEESGRDPSVSRFMFLIDSAVEAGNQALLAKIVDFGSEKKVFSKEPELLGFTCAKAYKTNKKMGVWLYKKSLKNMKRHSERLDFLGEFLRKSNDSPLRADALKRVKNTPDSKKKVDLIVSLISLFGTLDSVKDAQIHRKGVAGLARRTGLETSKRQPAMQEIIDSGIEDGDYVYVLSKSFRKEKDTLTRAEAKEAETHNKEVFDKVLAIKSEKIRAQALSLVLTEEKIPARYRRRAAEALLNLRDAPSRNRAFGAALGSNWVSEKVKKECFTLLISSRYHRSKASALARVVDELGTEKSETGKSAFEALLKLPRKISRDGINKILLDYKLSAKDKLRLNKAKKESEYVGQAEELDQIAEDVSVGEDKSAKKKIEDAVNDLKVDINESKVEYNARKRILKSFKAILEAAVEKEPGEEVLSMLPKMAGNAMVYGEDETARIGLEAILKVKDDEKRYKMLSEFVNEANLDHPTTLKALDYVLKNAEPGSRAVNSLFYLLRLDPGLQKEHKDAVGRVLEYLLGMENSEVLEANFEVHVAELLRSEDTRVREMAFEKMASLLGTNEEKEAVFMAKALEEEDTREGLDWLAKRVFVLPQASSILNIVTRSICSEIRYGGKAYNAMSGHLARLAFEENAKSAESLVGLQEMESRYETDLLVAAAAFGDEETGAWAIETTENLPVADNVKLDVYQWIAARAKNPETCSKAFNSLTSNSKIGAREIAYVALKSNNKEVKEEAYERLLSKPIESKEELESVLGLIQKDKPSFAFKAWGKLVESGEVKEHAEDFFEALASSRLIKRARKVKTYSKMLEQAYSAIRFPETRAYALLGLIQGINKTGDFNNGQDKMLAAFDLLVSDESVHIVTRATIAKSIEGSIPSTALVKEAREFLKRKDVVDSMGELETGKKNYVDMVTVAYDRKALDEIKRRIDVHEPIAPVKANENARAYWGVEMEEKVCKQFGKGERSLIELVVNAAEAVKENEGSKRVDIEYSPYAIRIADNGTGMSFDTLVLRLMMPFSGTKNPYLDVGRFGIGFLSSLEYCLNNPGNSMVIVETNNGDGAYRLVFGADGSKVEDIYVVLQKGARKEKGTEITITGLDQDVAGLRDYFDAYLRYYNPEKAEIYANGNPVNPGREIDMVSVPTDFEIEVGGEKKTVTQDVRLGIDFEAGLEGRENGVYSLGQGVFINDLRFKLGKAVIDFPAAVLVEQSRKNLKMDENYERAVNSIKHTAIEIAKKKIQEGGEQGAYARMAVPALFEELGITDYGEEVTNALYPPNSCIISSTSEWEKLSKFFGKEAPVFLVGNYRSYIELSKHMTPTNEFAENGLIVIGECSASEIRDAAKKKGIILENTEAIQEYAPRRERFILVMSEYPPGDSPFYTEGNVTYVNVDHPYFKKKSLAARYGVMTYYLLNKSGYNGRRVEEKMMDRYFH